ncbi:hypothetical protein FPL00_00820 [Xanthomonas citri pv. glycines]|nr:hypothetical protein FPL00_00820 [Xanthomonas citri pv. glycines]QDS18520.1 hypothetical protein FPL05_00970 [Xanthomonas citri pv. glycines]
MPVPVWPSPRLRSIIETTCCWMICCETPGLERSMPSRSSGSAGMQAMPAHDPRRQRQLDA